MELLKRSSSMVWMALMLATIATTWWLSKDIVAARVATVATFLIAAFKVRMVLLYFMELKHAPSVVRWIFEAWVLVATGAVIGIYLQTALAGG